MRCLSTGRVRLKRGERGARRYLPGGWRDETLPVNVFLIEHPRCLCVFDTGQTARAAAPGYFPRWYPFFRLSRFELEPEDEARAQLARRGTDPGAIELVVLSHLHTDHAGGISHFTRSEIVVARAEWNAAQGLGGRLRGYLPQYWPRELRPRLVDFTGPPIGPFSGSLELGDGLVLVPTPGHTRGHAALIVRGPGGGWFLGGDLAHDASELERTAPAVAAFCRSERLVFLAAHDPAAEGLLESSSPSEGVA